MNNKLIIFSAFLIVAVAQLFVPAKMIWDRETILEEGKLHKFKTAPIDPYDPFRGKYITLSFTNQRITKPNSEGTTWERGQEVFALLALDTAGFSIIEDIQQEKPNDGADYLKTKVTSVDIYWNSDGSEADSSTVSVEFPFDRFYMEESKAYEAELAYRDARWERKSAYALVSIREGDAVLKDVLIEDVSIREIAKERNEKKLLEESDAQ